MKAKTAKETLSITTKVVLPNDTNTLGNLFGGQLLAWMDVISSVAAHRHCRRVLRRCPRDCSIRKKTLANGY